MNKKFFLLAALLITILRGSAQWSDNPNENTLLAIGSTDYEELYQATDKATGGTYLQWCHFGADDFVPCIQYFDVNGVKQWGDNGINVCESTGNTMSYGMSLACTSEGNAVSMLGIKEGNVTNIYAFMISPSGDFVWGNDGIRVFDNSLRAQLAAGNDGGVWALTTNVETTHARYIEADGSLGPIIDIIDNERFCSYPAPIVDKQNNIFIVYQKMRWISSTYYEKEVYVEKYAKDGTLLHAPVKLMTPSTMTANILVNAIADTKGGGYAWMHHTNNNYKFKTYVFHFDENGESTIDNPEGALLNIDDNINDHFYASCVVDPTTNNACFVYREYHSSNGTSFNGLKYNRISETGERLIGDNGVVIIPTQQGKVIENITAQLIPQTDITLVSYTDNVHNSTIEAKAINPEGEELWHKQICSVVSNKTMAKNADGFVDGQNIFVWADNRNDTTACYGQNIFVNGDIGSDNPCVAPTNINASYLFLSEEDYGVNITWNIEPNTHNPNHFNLYYSTNNQEYTLINEIPYDNSNSIEYYTSAEIGTHYYKVTAVYDFGDNRYETKPANSLNEPSNDYVTAIVTSANETYNSKIRLFPSPCIDKLTITDAILSKAIVYNNNGQQINNFTIDSNSFYISTKSWSSGVYYINIINNSTSKTYKIVKE